MTGWLTSMDDAPGIPSGFPFPEPPSCTRKPREFFSFVRRAIPRWGFQVRFGILMLLVIPASASDESETVVVTRCSGPSIGRAIFYRTSPETRTRWGEWEKVDLASVSFSLVYRDGDPDILYRESKSGELKSYQRRLPTGEDSKRRPQLSRDRGYLSDGAPSPAGRDDPTLPVPARQARQWGCGLG